MKQISQILCVALLGFLWLSTSAMAHSPLKSTSPKDKAIVDAVPTEIIMNFGKPARLTKVTLTHSKGDSSHSDKVALPSKKFEKSFILATEFRGAGKYQVDWRALSNDGHALKGSFTFSVEE